MKGFYIKQTERVHDSGYKCFDIYDENKKLIKNLRCDAIDIDLNNNILGGNIMFEIVDDMIHIWSRNVNLNLEDPFSSTLTVDCRRKLTKGA